MNALTKNVRRLPGWWLSAAISLGLIGVIAEQQLGVLLYKVVQVNVGVMLAYVADTTLFRSAPEMSDKGSGGSRMIARAIVALAVILGITLGL